jgi:hypothetical protein
VAKGRKASATGAIGAGSLTVTLRGGVVTFKGKKLDLGALDQDLVHVGVTIGTQRLAGSGTFRTRGKKRVYP